MLGGGKRPKKPARGLQKPNRENKRWDDPDEDSDGEDEEGDNDDGNNGDGVVPEAEAEIEDDGSASNPGQDEDDDEINNSSDNDDDGPDWNASQRSHPFLKRRSSINNVAAAQGTETGPRENEDEEDDEASGDLDRTAATGMSSRMMGGYGAFGGSDSSEDEIPF